MSVSQITRLEEKHIGDQRNIKRMVEEQMRTQKEQAEAAISAARERSTAEKERYLRQRRPSSSDRCSQTKTAAR